jgi:hypothetical protein
MNKITVVCHKDHSHGYEDFEGKCLLCVVDDLMLEIGNLMIQKRRAEQREWVGLTDGDVHDAFNFVEFVKQISFDRDRPEWCENFAAYLEAKLKEKNHG